MPITVLQQISVGLPSALRALLLRAMAASTAATSWPSTGPITCQP
jgi:hypothetical protein